MTVGARRDPYTNFNFQVEIGGTFKASFQQVSGFDSTIEVIERHEGGRNTAPRKYPGLTRYSNIQLRRGVTDDRFLYEWHRRAINGTLERHNGSIVLMDRSGKETARWNFTNAWPTRYGGPELDSEGNDLAIEVLELAHEGLVRVK
jgi:phage tail-like protein